jgi:ankyrin repeat protein
LDTDDEGQTAVHLAAFYGSVQILKKIWECAEAVTPALTKILLISEDIEGKTAWQLAAE